MHRGRNSKFNNVILHQRMVEEMKLWNRDSHLLLCLDLPTTYTKSLAFGAFTMSMCLLSTLKDFPALKKQVLISSSHKVVQPECFWASNLMHDDTCDIVSVRNVFVFIYDVYTDVLRKQKRKGMFLLAKFFVHKRNSSYLAFFSYKLSVYNSRPPFKNIIYITFSY